MLAKLLFLIFRQLNIGYLSKTLTNLFYNGSLIRSTLCIACLSLSFFDFTYSSCSKCNVLLYGTMLGKCVAISDFVNTLKEARTCAAFSRISALSFDKYLISTSSVIMLSALHCKILSNICKSVSSSSGLWFSAGVPGVLDFNVLSYFKSESDFATLGFSLLGVREDLNSSLSTLLAGD
eukprot:NODE_190_length_15503_cov_0.365814.p7 type:complete len:179 gc:universal NODE_190_length_15503_cov_0.365814:12780-13316(+)